MTTNKNTALPLNADDKDDDDDDDNQDKTRANVLKFCITTPRRGECSGINAGGGADHILPSILRTR